MNRQTRAGPWTAFWTAVAVSLLPSCKLAPREKDLDPLPPCPQQVIVEGRAELDLRESGDNPRWTGREDFKTYFVNEEAAEYELQNTTSYDLEGDVLSPGEALSAADTFVIEVISSWLDDGSGHPLADSMSHYTLDRSSAALYLRRDIPVEAGSFIHTMQIEDSHEDTEDDGFILVFSYSEAYYLDMANHACFPDSGGTDPDGGTYDGAAHPGGMGLRVPYLDQLDIPGIGASACSSASSAMVLAYHGKVGDDQASMVAAAESIFDATATELRGLTSRSGLATHLEDEWGFSSVEFEDSGWEGLYDTIREEIDSARPLILGSRSINSGGHYMVVTGYNGDDFETAQLILNDPYGLWLGYDRWDTSASGEGVSVDFRTFTSDSSDGVFVLLP